jgi:hypothetical protein
MNTSFDLIEVGGFIASIEGMRYPTKSKSDSEILYARDIKSPGIKLGPKDIALAVKLVKQGSVHAKFQRGITAWFEINMPRSIWAELDTYSVGVDMISSESTMYTLVKECRKITEEMFVDYTPQDVIDQFAANVANLSCRYGSRQDIPIEVLKSCLPEGWLQRRNRGFSYQCLSSMYYYRKDHRMPEWSQVICPAIEQLPYFKELILGEE